MLSGRQLPRDLEVGKVDLGANSYLSEKDKDGTWYFKVPFKIVFKIGKEIKA